MWKDIEAAPPDAIFGLTEAFKKDESPDKINLGAGVYKNEQGITPIFACVKDAERILLGREQTKSYLPISGDPGYGVCVQNLLFGADSEIVTGSRAATAHAPGGTGALRMGAELLKRFRPAATVWLSGPTWANHRAIFSAPGFSINTYPYYDAATRQLAAGDLLSCLATIPAGDIVVLHGCCHNPSGVDLDTAQWEQVFAISKERGWLPLIDFAYQGFADGIEADRTAIELCARAGGDFFVASSFSKNFGLYNERTGALTIVSPSKEEAAVAMSHLKATIRACYSTPPAHGGLVVKTILEEPDLRGSWEQELTLMRERIAATRTALVEGLAAHGVKEDYRFIANQRGMFSFSGLDEQAVAWLREEKSIYMVGGGRINVAGLNANNIDYFCGAVAEAIHR
jgi:aspartate/tyrosine/aromatic aminotransferase